MCKYFRIAYCPYAHHVPFRSFRHFIYAQSREYMEIIFTTVAVYRYRSVTRLNYLVSLHFSRWWCSTVLLLFIGVYISMLFLQMSLWLLLIYFHVGLGKGSYKWYFTREICCYSFPNKFLKWKVEFSFWSCDFFWSAYYR